MDVRDRQGRHGKKHEGKMGTEKSKLNDGKNITTQGSHKTL